MSLIQNIEYISHLQIVRDVSDQIKTWVLLRTGLIFSLKHWILLSINLAGELYVCLFVLCGAEMYSSFTTKASTEVNEQKINRCTQLLQTWHILQEADFCKNRTLCCIWAQIL